MLEAICKRAQSCRSRRVSSLHRFTQGLSSPQTSHEQASIWLPQGHVLKSHANEQLLVSGGLSEVAKFTDRWLLLWEGVHRVPSLWEKPEEMGRNLSVKKRADFPHTDSAGALRQHLLAYKTRRNKCLWCKPAGLLVVVVIVILVLTALVG